MITFSFRPIRWSTLPLIAASVRTLVVSWKEAADKKESVAKEAGASIKLKEFVRFETGEGIEKKEENFAEEVAKQMGN